MTDPVDSADPIVLDSSVLVAYERMKTPGAFGMHETQSRIAEWLVQQVPLLVPALSLAVASHECGGDLPELDYLIQGDPELVLVVPLARESSVDVGAASTSLVGEDLEVAHVVWCATGHEDDGDPASRWPVATYWPDWYAGSGVPIIGL
ncbi:MAG: hypothetical protein V7637_6000 [Mycobacteriales bacterium]